jgi:hypothetical protein
MRSLTLLLFTLTIGARAQCTFTLSPTSAQAPAAASMGSFSVAATQSNCPRSATSNATWLTVTFGQTGAGNGSVGYTVDANPTYATRTAAISVGGAAFTVTQAAPPCPAVGFSPSAQAVEPGGGAFSITITSPCGWNASSDSGWIMLQSTSGPTSGVLVYVVAPNNSGVSRSGNILIGPNKFGVVQSSIDCTFTVAPTFINVVTAGGQNQIGVQVSNSACPWTVQNIASWIGNLTINGSAAASSTGNGTVGFTVAANSSAQPRTTTLVVANQPVAITQAGNVCTFTLTPAGITVAYPATTGAFSIATSLSNCPWTATSGSNWISLTS